MIHFVLLGVFVAVPLAWSARVLFGRYPTRLDGYAGKAALSAYAGVSALVGPWWTCGYPLLALVLAAWITALSRPCRLREPRRTRTATLGRGLSRAAAVVTFAVLAVIGFEAARGWVAPDGVHELGWPLDPGIYAAGQGGASALVNAHFDYGAQRFAFDLVRAPLRQVRLAPSPRLDAYASFGTRVRGPCRGVVHQARDGMPDLQPPAADATRPGGNLVAIDCDGGPRVFLAHLARGSVAVRAGARVALGQVVGRIGNSGNTTEPHLHVHAVDARTGAAAAVTLGGRFPARNRIVWIR